ncbi:HNH endonuclease family protein [Streptomyces sp. NPDC002793]|uniref:HNH endonuclease family protein n=1 Tax=Streptomyces sp. NPDC002793 TaxID=3154432 RepID=UPI00331CB8D8
MRSFQSTHLPEFLAVITPRHVLISTALLAVCLTACNPAATTDPDDKQASPTSSATGAAAPGVPAGGSGTPLSEAVAMLPLGEESRTGYERDSFHHWIDEDGDGCDTRREVLLAEAVTTPEQGNQCAITGGSWSSFYDEVEVVDARKLDIDHMVPLAEAWDSGASQWTADRREQYANDLGSERSLVAVTAKSNRSKSDRDPGEWLPSAASAQCTYASDWVATKLRWKLTIDAKEQAALEMLAGDCPDTVVEYEVAP